MPPPVGGGLPSLDGATFDAVLVGTDLPQALLAAALSLAGRSVLHVDAGDGYGGRWSTRPLGDWQAALGAAVGVATRAAADAAGDGGAAAAPPAEPPLAAPALAALSERFGPGAAVVPTPHLAVGAFPPPALTAWPPPAAAAAAVDVPPADSVDGRVNTAYANGGSPPAPPVLDSTAPSAPAASSASASASAAPLVAAGVPAAAAGRIALDQLPRPLLGAGALVPLLQSTSAGYYVEFVAVDGAYVHFGDAAAASAAGDGGGAAGAPATVAAAPVAGAAAAPVAASALTGLHRVPTSRADVFRSPALGPVDKRLLMRFLSACAADGAASGGAAVVSSVPPVAAAASARVALPPGETFEQHMVAAGLGPVSRAFLRHAVAGPSAAASVGTDSSSGQAGSAASDAGGPAVVEGTPPGVVGVVLSGGDVVTTSWLFAPPPPPPPPASPLGSSTVPAVPPSGSWRWVGVTDGRLLPAAARPIVYVPAGATGGTASDVTVLSVDSGGRAVPDGLHAVSAATAEGGGVADLVAVLSSLLGVAAADEAGSAAGPADAAAAAAEGDGDHRGSAPPRVLWGALYWQPGEAPPPSPPPPSPTPPRWEVVRAATGGVDADQAVAEAARCYELVGGLPPFFAPPAPPQPEPEADAATEEDAGQAVAETATTAAAAPAATAAAGGMAAMPNGARATSMGGAT